MDAQILEFRRGRDLIDVTSLYQVKQWTEIFNVSRLQLVAAVRAVGRQSSDVKAYLQPFKQVGANTAPLN